MKILFQQAAENKIDVVLEVKIENPEEKERIYDLLRQLVRINYNKEFKYTPDEISTRIQELNFLPGEQFDKSQLTFTYTDNSLRVTALQISYPKVNELSQFSFTYEELDILTHIYNSDGEVSIDELSRLIPQPKMQEYGTGTFGELVYEGGAKYGLGDTELALQVKKEIYKLICTKNRAYSEARRQFTHSFKELVPIVATAVSSSLGIGTSIIMGVTTAVLLIIFKLPVNAWCTVNSGLGKK